MNSLSVTSWESLAMLIDNESMRLRKIRKKAVIRYDPKLLRLVQGFENEDIDITAYVKSIERNYPLIYDMVSMVLPQGQIKHVKSNGLNRRWVRYIAETSYRTATGIDYVSVRDELVGRLRWKRSFVNTTETILSMEEKIMEATAECGERGLLSGLSDIRVSMPQINRITLQFNVSGVTVNTPRGIHIIAPTRYYINYRQVDSDFQYYDVRGESIAGSENRINPHVGGGLGGKACLGGFDYSVAQSATSGDLLQLLYTIMEFNRSVDVNDGWGRHVYRNTKAYRNPVNKRLYGDNKSLDLVYSLHSLHSLRGYYLTNTQVLPHDAYVTCCITGKKLLRSSAVRLPVYLSPEAVKSIEWGSLGSRLMYRDIICTNEADKRRYERDREDVINKFHKKNMRKYYEEALRMDAYEERVKRSRLSQGVSVTLSGFNRVNTA